MRRIQIIILLTWLSVVVAVYDKKYMDIISPDAYKPQNDSRFGYGIAYFDKELYISAPAAADGAQIYTYSITLKALAKTSLSMKPEMYIPEKYRVKNWYGASLKTGSSFLVICAPRTPYMYASFRITKGSCNKIVVQGRSLLIKELPAIVKTNIKEFNGGIDSYGWSIDVDKYDRVVVGGAAVVKDRNSGVKIHYDDSMAPTLANTRDILNLGYSIASGYFFSTTSVTYAVSTTYGDYGEGKILFFNEKLEYIETLDVGEVGTMYGAALSAGRLTGDRTSLLVGAPTWAGSGFDSGAVYVYVPANETKFVVKRILKGTASSGQFGSSIANIGDLDADNIDDFAIGAPYEGKGAVYIYTGFAILSGKTWWRKIQPENFNSFGFSLVPITKIHETGCNDLAIGAPLSNRAFVLKCLPVSTIQLYTIHPDLKLRSNLTYYQFQVCLNVTYPNNDIILQILMNIDLTHSAAKLEKNKGETMISLKSPSKKFCETYDIFTPIDGNYDEHLKLDITATLKSPKHESLPAVLSDRSITSLKESLWIANCNLQYGRCMPKLKVVMSSNLTTPYEVGLRNTEKFEIAISNIGEIAYNACTVVSVQPASIRSIPSECSYNVTGKQIICKPSRWILPNAIWNINDIEIDINSVTNKDQSIDINYDVYGHCGDDNERQSKDFSFPLIFHYNDIDVIGLSSAGKVINVTDQDVSGGKYFQHVYTISNNGPVDIVDATCEITLLKKSYLKYGVPKMTQQKDNIDTLLETCTIKTENETEEAVYMICNIDTLPKTSETSILLPLRILPNNFGAIRSENGTVITSITLQIPSNSNSLPYNKAISTSTTLVLQSTSLPTWMWILSILIALFLLVIIILVLREYNCFKRKNKENLEELRKSVRRRSTYRNMSRTSQQCQEN